MPTKKLLEKDVEKAVKKYAVKLGFWTRKFRSAQNRGVHDDVFGTPDGVVFWIEFKRPGETWSELQFDEAKEMRACKLKTFLIDDIGEGKRLIDDMALFGETEMQNNGAG